MACWPGIAEVERAAGARDGAAPTGSRAHSKRLLNRDRFPHARMIAPCLASFLQRRRALRKPGNPMNARQSERYAALLLVWALALNVALFIW